MLNRSRLLEAIRTRFEAEWQAKLAWDANLQMTDVIILSVRLSSKANIVLVVNVDMKLINKVSGEAYSGKWTHHCMQIVYNPRTDGIVDIEA